MIPENLTHFGPQWFLGELAFVLLLISGMVVIWRYARKRLLVAEDAFWAIAAEALIVVPWILSGVLFCASLVGGFGSALVTVQVALAAAGLTGLWSVRHSAGNIGSAAGRLLRESWITVAALVAVCVFVYWGWIVPFPDPFNGHHHGTINLISELWRSGSYPALPQPWIGYETAIFTPPAASKMMLSIFALPGVDAVGARPALLVPGVFALFTLQLLRLTGSELFGRAVAGSIAFLLVAFSYTTTADFTDITLDFYTPVLLTYLALHVARMVRTGEARWFPFVLFAAFSAIVRPQVLLLGLGVIAALLVVGLVPWRDLGRSIVETGRARVALITVGLSVPALAWWAYVAVRFDDVTYAARVLTGRFDSSPTGSFGIFQFDTIAEATLDGQNYLLSLFFPLFLDRGFTTLVKNLFAGLGFSVLLTAAIVAFIVGARRILGPELGARTRRLALAYLGGFLAVMVVAFPVYPKYTVYGAFLLAPFAAMFLLWVARTRAGRVVAYAAIAAVFVAGIGYGAYNTWGHTAGDSSLTNVKLLAPWYGDAIDRLARATGRSRESVETEIAEYDAAVAALGPGEHILFMDLEPGALVPAIVDRAFLADHPYLTTERARDVLEAETDPALADALDRLGVRYVYQPGRAFPVDVEESLIMRRLAAHDGEAEYVIPVSELLQEKGPPS